MQDVMHRTMNSKFLFLGVMFPIEMLHDEKTNYPDAFVTYLLPLLDFAFWGCLTTNILELKVLSQVLFNCEHQESVAKTVTQLCRLGDEENI